MPQSDWKKWKYFVTKFSIPNITCRRVPVKQTHIYRKNVAHYVTSDANKPLKNGWLPIQAWLPWDKPRPCRRLITQLFPMAVLPQLLGQEKHLFWYSLPWDLGIPTLSKQCQNHSCYWGSCATKLRKGTDGLMRNGTTSSGFVVMINFHHKNHFQDRLVIVPNCIPV